MNDQLIFGLYEGYATGEKFYRFDGEEVEPLFSEDTAPVPSQSWGTISGSFKGDLYFNADDPAFGPSLWKYDGTSASMVTDLGEHDDQNAVYKMIAAENILYFIATETVNHYFLWRSDGTQAGTSVIKEINNDTNSPAVTIGDKLFFIEGSYITSEVWVSDGTEAGTHVTKDINVATNTEPYYFLKIGDQIYFKGWDEEHGFELWKTDGTEEGTVMIKDITPGAGNTELSLFYKLGNNLAFMVQDPLTSADILWTSDGTEAGTKMLHESAPQFGLYPAVYGLYQFNDRIIFTVMSSDNNEGIWITDGTQAGTVKLLSHVGYPPLYGGMAVGDKFYIFDNHVLWITDGTPAGTTVVKDLGEDVIPQINVGGIYTMTDGALFYFFANDAEYSQELWVSDGTAEGTKKIHIREVNEPYDPMVYPFFLGMYEGKVFFRTAVEHNYEIWTSDGTEEGTALFKEIVPGDIGSWNSAFSYQGDAFYFQALEGENGVELWRSDGTADGTKMVKDIVHGPKSSQAYSLIPMSATEAGDFSRSILGPNDREIYVVADDGIHGSELWVSDGTAVKTRLIADLVPGPANSYLYFADKLGDRFLFLANDFNGHSGIWYIDDRDHWINFDAIEDKLATDEAFDLTASSSQDFR